MVTSSDSNPTFSDSTNDYRKKKAFRFKPKHDIVLLNTIKQFMPWAAVHGYVREVWASAADAFSLSMREKFTNLDEYFGEEGNNEISPANGLIGSGSTFHVNHIACKRRFDTLIDAHRRGDLESLRASGSEEECCEREQLLMDIDRLISTHDEWRKNNRTRKNSSNSSSHCDDAFPYLSGTAESILDSSPLYLTKKSPELTGKPSDASPRDNDNLYVGKTYDSAGNSIHGANDASEVSLAYRTKGTTGSDSYLQSKKADILASDRQLMDEALHLKRRKLDIEEKRVELKKEKHRNLISTMQSHTAAVQALTAALLSVAQQFRSHDT
uniref:AlNc14C3G453 protein n=1 Tax=Albugo laibachii Nc14 TaxID=890382 RepID=F0VZX5_9STRA|nr:AlNc14C3G453 [Albugo laibachii Nc14]|eukprot:CCA14346.1 AlNc14C3G453 [Albugo laibachii Nc14]